MPWEKIWFQEGSIQFWYNDLDQSLENMKKVTAKADEVDLNTGVQAWLRMGQIYDMKQRRKEAVEAYRKAIAYAPEADAAQESQEVPRHALPAHVIRPGYSIVTFTGCSISFGSFPPVRIISAIRPVALAGILNLDLGGGLSGDDTLQIVLAVGQVNFAHIGLIRGSPRSWRRHPRFCRYPVRSEHMRGIASCAARSKTRNQKRQLQKTVSSEYPFL